MLRKENAAHLIPVAGRRKEEEEEEKERERER